jgi:hypothetical protein
MHDTRRNSTPEPSRRIWSLALGGRRPSAESAATPATRRCLAVGQRSGSSCRDQSGCRPSTIRRRSSSPGGVNELPHLGAVGIHHIDVPVAGPLAGNH